MSESGSTLFNGKPHSSFRLLRCILAFTEKAILCSNRRLLHDLCPEQFRTRLAAEQVSSDNRRSEVGNLLGTVRKNTEGSDKANRFH